MKYSLQFALTLQTLKKTLGTEAASFEPGVSHFGTKCALERLVDGVVVAGAAQLQAQRQ